MQLVKVVPTDPNPTQRGWTPLLKTMPTVVARGLSPGQFSAAATKTTGEANGADGSPKKRTLCTSFTNASTRSSAVRGQAFLDLDKG